MREMGLKKWLKNRGRIFWFLVSTVLMFLVVSFTGVQEFLEVVSEASLVYVVVAFVIANISVFVNSFVLFTILNIVGADLRYLETLELDLAALFIHNLTPLADVGGQPFIAALVSERTGLEFERGLSAVISASTIKMAPFYVAGIIALFLLVSPYIPLFLIALSVLIYSLYRYGKLNFLNDFFTYLDSFTKLKLYEGILNFKNTVFVIFSDRKRVATLSAFAGFSLIFEVLAVFVIGVAYGVSLDILLLFLIMPLSRLAGYFPTPGGSGAYEALLTGLLMQFYPVSPSIAVAITVTYRFLTYYFGIIAGYLAFNKITKNS